MIRRAEAADRAAVERIVRDAYGIYVERIGKPPASVLDDYAALIADGAVSVLEDADGRLAAIMKFRQQAGLTREQAADWVVRHIPPKMRHRLGSVTPATVDSWLVKWGGNRGTTPGSGRDGYLCMRAILDDQRPTEPQLKKILEMLAKSLPS